MTEAIPFFSREPQTDQRDWLETLSAALAPIVVKPGADFSSAERCAARIAIVADPDPLDLAAFPNLVWVQSLWAGVEGLLSDLGDARFDIVRMTDPNLAQTMAEAVLAWTLYLHRDMPRYHTAQAEKRWRQHRLVRAEDRPIGLLGLGNLGSVAAEVLKSQGFPLSGWSRRPKHIDGIACHSAEAGLRQVLQSSDILVCLLPLTPATHDLLNAERLALLPKHASVINFGRGALIDDDALLDALDAGRLGHAVLDVFREEPLPPTSPFWTHPGVTVLPHIAAPTTKSSAARIAAVNVTRYLETGELPPVVSRRRGY
ncbi:MAG: 2-hydroxyacid dehydrogenase [Magnetovibrionaceae bacterium]